MSPLRNVHAHPHQFSDALHQRFPNPEACKAIRRFGVFGSGRTPQFIAVADVEASIPEDAAWCTRLVQLRDPGKSVTLMAFAGSVGLGGADSARQMVRSISRFGLEGSNIVRDFEPMPETHRYVIIEPARTSLGALFFGTASFFDFTVRRDGEVVVTFDETGGEAVGLRNIYDTLFINRRRLID